MDEEKKQNEEKGINLLPAELQRKQKVIRQIIARSEMEYTSGDTAGTKKNKASGAQLKQREKKPGFFSKLLARLQSSSRTKKSGTPQVREKIVKKESPKPQVQVVQKSIQTPVSPAKEPEKQKLSEPVPRVPENQEKPKPKMHGDLPQGKPLPSALFAGIGKPQPEKPEPHPAPEKPVEHTEEKIAPQPPVARIEHVPSPAPHKDEKKHIPPLVKKEKKKGRGIAGFLKSLFLRPAKKTKIDLAAPHPSPKIETPTPESKKESPPPAKTEMQDKPEKEGKKELLPKKDKKKGFLLRLFGSLSRKKTGVVHTREEKAPDEKKSKPVAAPALPTKEEKPRTPQKIEQAPVVEKNNDMHEAAPEEKRSTKPFATDFVHHAQEPKTEQAPQSESKKKPSNMAEALHAWHKKGSTKVPAHKPMGFEVNLLTKEYAEVFSPKNRARTLIWSSVSALLFVVLVYVSIHLYEVRNRSGLAEATSVINQMERAITSYSDLQEEDTVLRAKVDAIGTLLDKHISIESFLVRIEDVTIPEVTYTAIALSNDGTVVLSALAQDYTSLARQLAVYEREAPWVDDVFVTSANLERDDQAQVNGVSFDITVTVDKEVFTQQY